MVHQMGDGVAQMKTAEDLLGPEDNQLNTLNEKFWPSLHYKNDSVDFNQDIHTLLPIFNQLNVSSFKLTYSYDERIPPLIYLVIVSLMMQAIRDIDNPYKGSVKPKYENLRNLRTLL